MLILNVHLFLTWIGVGDAKFREWSVAMMGLGKPQLLNLGRLVVAYGTKRRREGLGHLARSSGAPEISLIFKQLYTYTISYSVIESYSIYDIYDIKCISFLFFFSFLLLRLPLLQPTPRPRRAPGPR